ncbi:flagellar hook-length control protein FliK [Ramlibacter alkalitolerans]|uniref:Flagellar hook-length control protein FliK n=1 Tax=Ramlibacter alkalitolerans TaxID=2039631 RepID=A0ABS1JKZ4_9BURK|nr:flagellar hook-length control protein FliK [Ramlibacter alkalitolerans]MBL0424888.1 flagellar hook-length control protein FliK [Ramlibacter alkalitolerans]
MHSAAPAPAMHHAALSSRPSEPQFATDLGAQVRWMVSAGVQEARLELNPADLGPIRVQLTLTAQTADISFAAVHHATREGIAQALPVLRDMLAAQGLQLGQSAVGGGQSGGSFGAPPQQGARPSSAPRPGPAGGAGVAATGSARLAAGRGMLDLYA